MQINSSRLVDNFLKLVQIDSAPRAEAKMAEEILRQLQRLGVAAYMDNAGAAVGGNAGNVIAKIAGRADKPTIMFSAHMDRVEPGLKIKPVIRDGVIYSDGSTILAADDVAGIAAIIEAMHVLKETRAEHGPLEFVFTIVEEGGLHGAKNVDYSQLKAGFGYALDSSGPVGSAIIQGPAQDKIEAVIFGKAAHAGVNPEDGINAIVAASRGVAAMKTGRVDHETTANIGTIKGGTATNIVTDKVEILAEARSLQNDKLERQSQHMRECLEQAATAMGARAEVKVARMYSAFRLEESLPVIALFKRACRQVNLSGELIPSGGGSDANIFNANGIPTANIGIGYKKVHTTEENIAIRDLEAVARLTLALVTNA